MHVGEVGRGGRAVGGMALVKQGHISTYSGSGYETGALVQVE